ncbi:MAG TPA: hypothetical protein DDY78_16220 [Planctomycetales bacterium]|jgi:hypothetical protein|nr:hypothetical protein [Planctomycetales bacterium]
MTRVLIDANLPPKLLQVTDAMELCDGTGRVLCRVYPVMDLSEYEPWEPPISEEELQRREQSDKWFSTEEVLAHLKSLEGQ